MAGFSSLRDMRVQGRRNDSFMSGDNGRMPYSSTMLSLQEKSRKGEAVLGRTSGCDSQDVDVSGFV